MSLIFKRDAPLKLLSVMPHESAHETALCIVWGIRHFAHIDKASIAVVKSAFAIAAFRRGFMRLLSHCQAGIHVAQFFFTGVWALAQTSVALEKGLS